MICEEHELPLTRQAQLVGISRGATYYEPRPLPASDLMLMRRIDELHLEHPFAGSRMLRDLLNREGHQVGRKRVRTLMRRMGIEAIYRRKNTSRAYDTVSIARASLARYFAFYNATRPHASLDRRTPDEMYFESLSLAQAA